MQPEKVPSDTCQRYDYTIIYNSDSSMFISYDEKSRMNGEHIRLYVFRTNSTEEIFYSENQYFAVDWFNQNTLKLLKTKLIQSERHDKSSEINSYVFYDLDQNKFIQPYQNKIIYEN